MKSESGQQFILEPVMVDEDEAKVFQATARVGSAARKTWLSSLIVL